MNSSGPQHGSATRRSAAAIALLLGLVFVVPIRGATLGGDRGYDTRALVTQLRERNVTPHVAQNVNRCGGSVLDERTTRHEGYVISQRKRKQVEEVFGWLKTIALQRKTRFRGTERVVWMFTLAAAAYNLVRMRNLQAATA